VAIRLFAAVATVVAIFAVGVRIDNLERRQLGQRPYSLDEATELIGPGVAMITTMAVAYARP
jgi:hypothetical protein